MAVKMHEASSAGVERPLWRRVLRIGFPQVVIGLAACLYFGTMIKAGHDTERQWLQLFRTGILMLAGFLLALWSLFFSGWRKSRVAAVLALLFAGGWGLFRVEYDGDLRGSVHGRYWVLHLFEVSHEDEVAAHRARQTPEKSERVIDLSMQPGDFAGYRGARRDGVVYGPPLGREWQARPPREIWKQPIYGGYSSFASVNGYLFTMEQRHEDEAVVCYDAANGHELWERRWPGRFMERMGGAGPRSTPTVFDGDVFALGALGHLVCIEGKSGALKWAVDILAGNRNLTWAMCGSPLVYGNLVVVNPGTQSAESAGRALMAFDRHTGAEVWRSGKFQAGYSAPMLARLCGKLQILLFDGAGLGGYDPDNGAELWRFAWRTQGADGINVAQPVVLKKSRPVDVGSVALAGSAVAPSSTEDAGRIFIASGYGRGGALVQVECGADGWVASEVWSTGRKTMRCKFSSPVAYQGHIYGLDDGNLQCLDLEDGRVLWTDNREPGEGAGVGHGQLLLANDLLVILSEYGEVVLVEARPDRYTELGRVKVLEGEKTWSNPTLVNGRLYIRNHRQMACLDLR